MEYRELSGSAECRSVSVDVKDGVKCGVLSVKCSMWIVECGVRVCSGECRVWSIKCGMRNIKDGI